MGSSELQAIRSQKESMKADFDKEKLRLSRELDETKQSVIMYNSLLGSEIIALI